MPLLTEIDLLNRGARRTFLFAHLGIFLLCFLFSLAYILGLNLVNFVRDNLIGALPRQELMVEVKKVEMAIFRMDAPDAVKLTDEALAQMAAIEGVDQVLPIKYATAPVAVEGSFFGQQFGSQIVVQGFEPVWVADELPGLELDWKPGEDVPVLINSQLLAIYNNGFAKASGLPELSAAAIVNRKFTIVVGDRARGIRELQARVVGLSSKVGIGICVPNRALEYLHEGFTGAAPTAVQAVVRVGNIGALESVKQTIADLGFHIVEPPALVKALVKAGRIAGVLAVCVAVLLMVVAVTYLNQTVKMLFYLKRRDYAMCRAMGMDRTRLRLLLLLEMLIWVLLDAVFAFSFAVMLGHWVNGTYLNELLLKLTGLTMTLQIPLTELVGFAGLLLLASTASLVPRIYMDTRREVGVALKGH